MTAIYYSEINLICIVILHLFIKQMHYKSDRFSSENRTFSLLLLATIIMCVADMAAGICRGQSFRGARAVIEFSNLLYYEALSVISFLWFLYVFIKIKIINNYGKRLLLWAIPLILISIVTVINPFTNFLFTIDENNLYTRNFGVYFHWAVMWLYFLTATGGIIYKISKEHIKHKRKQITPLLYFIIAPAVAALIQMLLYGVSCSQAGITVSIVAIFLTEQKNQIHKDSLTGLNNRYGFNQYWERYLQRKEKTELFLMMIDINSFKRVNDKFGHLEGDRALADVADVLKQICDEANAKLFACRYGGDEFLIAGDGLKQEEIKALKVQIEGKLKEKNRTEHYPYVLSVSIGTAGGACSSQEDVEQLLLTADEEMYGEKSKISVQDV